MLIQSIPYGYKSCRRYLLNITPKSRIYPNQLMLLMQITSYNYSAGTGQSYSKYIASIWYISHMMLNYVKSVISEIYLLFLNVNHHRLRRPMTMLTMFTIVTKSIMMFIYCLYYSLSQCMILLTRRRHCPHRHIPQRREPSPAHIG